MNENELKGLNYEKKIGSLVKDVLPQSEVTLHSDKVYGTDVDVLVTVGYSNVPIETKYRTSSYFEVHDGKITEINHVRKRVGKFILPISEERDYTYQLENILSKYHRAIFVTNVKIDPESPCVLKIRNGSATICKEEDLENILKKILKN